jgi:hypothetical protein
MDSEDELEEELLSCFGANSYTGIYDCLQFAEVPFNHLPSPLPMTYSSVNPQNYYTHYPQVVPFISSTPIPMMSSSMGVPIPYHVDTSLTAITQPNITSNRQIASNLSIREDDTSSLQSGSASQSDAVSLSDGKKVKNYLIFILCSVIYLIHYFLIFH